MSVSKLLISVFLFLLLFGTSLNVAGNGNKVNADLIIYPDQDTYNLGSTINGLREYIGISATSHAFLRFPLEQIIFADTAHLEMRNHVDEVCTIGVFGVENDAWDELTFSDSDDLPAVTKLLDEVQILGTSWYKWDITDFVNSQTDGWVTLRLEIIDGPGYFNSNSKDANSESTWPFYQ